MAKVLFWVYSNKVAFFILVIAAGAVFGSCAGLLAYGMTLFITPDVTETQRKVIIPAFAVLGVGIALYLVAVDLWSRGNPGSEKGDNKSKTD